jgi:hypothetical protein
MDSSEVTTFALFESFRKRDSQRHPVAYLCTSSYGPRCLSILVAVRSLLSQEWALCPGRSVQYVTFPNFSRVINYLTRILRYFSVPAGRFRSSSLNWAATASFYIPFSSLVSVSRSFNAVQYKLLTALLIYEYYKHIYSTLSQPAGVYKSHDQAVH